MNTSLLSRKRNTIRFNSRYLGVATLTLVPLLFAASATASVDQPDASDLLEYAQDMQYDRFDAAAYETLSRTLSKLPYAQQKRRVFDWVDAQQNYEVTVRKGPYGVPHIQADDYGALGYGEAYAAAEDHVCNIALGFLQARGESSRYLGPGAKQSNIALDAVVRGLDLRGQARTALAAQSEEIRVWLAGYIAGFNRYLREHSGARNSSWCSGAAWLTEATPLDLMTRMVMAAQTLPRMSAAVAGAQAPDNKDGVASLTSETQQLAALEAAALDGMGSNGWALGRQYTENGRGMLLANPHYPWYGESRFWEKHLTIPGKLDIYGAQLLGSPGVSIGFNSALGWTHTVSASQRIVLYRLQLDPKNPMRYRYGEEWLDIEARSVDIPVAAEDGTTGTVAHTIYMTVHGPILTMPGMAWDNKYAYAARDANVGNHSLLAQWKAMGEATSLDEFIAAHRQYNAMPWVNTIATSKDGRALYLDNSTVGNLSASAEANWQESLKSDPVAAQLYTGRRMLLLDGSDPQNSWVNAPNVPIAGTVPFANRPIIEREDYVFNSNDSYWLSSPREPLTGYSVLYGPTESARSLRTRMNIRMLENEYGDAGDDGRFNIREIQRALFSNRGLGAELLLPELVQVCRGETPELAKACNVLAAYDGSLNLDSPGAPLFREWITRYDPLDTVTTGKLFAEDFDVDRPAATPAGLGDQDLALQSLRGAIAALEAAELPLDATLRDTQFAWRAGQAIAVHGGNGFEGVANLQMSGNPSASPISGVQTTKVADSRYLTDNGYAVVHGSSFIYTLSFEERGPVAEALLTYSQSGNPNSRHFRDQTLLYADKKWRRVAFHSSDVAQNVTSIRVLRSSDSR
ncbi:acyl-homoserine lactone acylase PvdQ [gamma proteobacterium NOR5-3]|nr:acyl-homoserine lactone acylase PvdQ [gamma proteobacterium NOR5-3]